MTLGDILEEIEYLLIDKHEMMESFLDMCFEDLDNISFMGG